MHQSTKHHSDKFDYVGVVEAVHELDALALYHA
jgi:hypothetical protein